MIHTQSKDLSRNDRQKALISSIFLGIFTLGISQLICQMALSSRSIKHKKSIETPLSFKENTNLNPHVKNGLEQCLAALDAMENDDLQRDITVAALLELGTFVMPFDKKKALKLFEKAKQMDKLKLGNVERSLALAKISIANPEEKLRIAYSLESKDVPFALRQVAIDLAKDNIEKSLEIARGLEGYEKFDALAGIIEIVTPNNYELGLELATEAALLAVSLRDNRSAIERIIDVFYAKHNRKTAFELANAIVPPQIGSRLVGGLKQVAFPIIGKEYAKDDLEGALKWANTLDNHIRIRVLCSMAQGISSTLPEMANQLIEQALALRDTEDHFELDKTLCIETMAILDLDKAQVLLQEVERKAEALLSMFKRLYPIDPEAALRLAPLLFAEETSRNEDPRTRFRVFIDFAKINVY